MALIPGTGGGGSGNVVDDTSPQLGGDLDTNNKKIVSTSNGNIDIEPHGTGNVLLGNYTFDADQTVGAGQDNYVLTYDNTAGIISLEASAGGGGGLSNVVEDTTPQLGGDLDLNGNQITSPDGSDLINIPNGSIDLQTNTTSRLDITDSGLRLGAANSRVTTILDEDNMSSDSATALATQQSIKAYADTKISDVVSDTTPQLGGDLDLNGNQITSPDGTDLINIPNGSIDLQTASTSRLDITDSGVRLGGANTRVTTILDEDTFSTNSATALATQQSIKAYTDTQVATKIGNLSEDTTPQLGGQLDINGNALGDGTRELLTFTEDASAVNNVNIENEATGSGPIISAVGDDTNIDLNISAKGTGNITLGNYTFDADQTVGAGQDNYVLTYDNTAGTISLEASAGGGGGLSNVVEDTTPQLGGDLDLNGNQITSPDGTDLINIPNGSIDLQTASTSRLDVTDSGVRLGGANARVTTILDEDTMTTNSATALATQQSIKAYADTKISDVVSDTTPQLGGQLDVNGNAIGDGTRELITFTEDASAVNHINIENQATGSGPIISAAGDDTNVDLNIDAKGTGNISIGNFTFDADQTVGAGQDNYVLTYDNSGGVISLEASAGGGSAADYQVGASDNGYYLGHWCCGSADNNIGMSADTVYAFPFHHFVETTTWTRIGADIVAAPGTGGIYIGIYSDSAGIPGSLEFDGGLIDISSTTGDVEATISQSLDPGLYWIVIASEKTGWNLRAYPNGDYATVATPMFNDHNPSANNCVEYYSGSHTFGALPSTFPSATASYGTRNLKRVALWLRKV